MELGIGLPNAVPGTTGDQLTDWARAAEEAGFSTLGTIDRIVYPNYEPIVALSAAAAVTERIRLVTDVMLGPLRAEPRDGRQAVPLPRRPGRRRPRRPRHRRSAAARTTTRSAASTCPPAASGSIAPWRRSARSGTATASSSRRSAPGPRATAPPCWSAATSQASFERAAKYGDGWTQGGSGPDQFKRGRREPR